MTNSPWVDVGWPVSLPNLLPGIVMSGRAAVHVRIKRLSPEHHARLRDIDHLAISTYVSTAEANAVGKLDGRHELAGIVPTPMRPGSEARDLNGEVEAGAMRGSP
jgi:hypothetical protein